MMSWNKLRPASNLAENLKPLILGGYDEKAYFSGSDLFGRFITKYSADRYG